MTGRRYRVRLVTSGHEEAADGVVDALLLMMTPSGVFIAEEEACLNAPNSRKSHAVKSAFPRKVKQILLFASLLLSNLLPKTENNYIYNTLC